MIKNIKLPPRTKFRGWDYNKWTELRMTGREWHEYAKRETFKTERGADAAWGGRCEVWFDNKLEA
jgi:hypothetical protein